MRSVFSVGERAALEAVPLFEGTGGKSSHKCYPPVLKRFSKVSKSHRTQTNEK